MKKAQTLLFLIIFLSLTAIASGNKIASANKKETLKRLQRIEIVSLDTIGYESVFAYPDEDLKDLFGEQIDSLFNSWIIQNTYTFDSFEDQPDGYNIASLPDSVYIKRLQSIDSYIDLSFNNTVKNVIELYTNRKRELTEIMIGLSGYYFPMIEEQLDKYNLPMELKYLPIIESALNPNARSRANAVGLWQFMYGTGKMYKLEIGTFVDERRDPEKSTEAAVKYLSDLYKIYKDWHLVIAAYNCGPGNVNKAIRRAGGKQDYWSVYYKLPRETRGYVPAFIAAAYVMNNFQNHGLSPRYPQFPIVTDTVKVHSYLHFKQISEIINIPVEELRALNPQYRIDIIPAKADKPYSLRLPVEKIAYFIDYEDEIFAHNRKDIFPNNEIKVPTGSAGYADDVQGKEKITYTVKQGDNLGYISNWYRVPVNNLRHWNNINKNMIRQGQKLVIYVPKQHAGHYAEVNRMTFAQKEEFAKKTPVSSAAMASLNSIEYGSDYIYYTVRSGDSLWSIARQFPGVSNNDIMKLNNMKGNTIKPGQKLKIQPKS